MAERRAIMYVASVSSATVTLSPDHPYRFANETGLGIRKVVVTTNESTAESGFYGTTGSCAVFEVILRRLQ